MRLILTLLLLTAGLPLTAADAWMRYEDGSRALLTYETLGGYRLFFHPDEHDPLRRSLVLSVPSSFHRKVWHESLKYSKPSQVAVIATKGVEPETLLTMCQVAEVAGVVLQQ